MDNAAPRPAFWVVLFASSLLVTLLVATWHDFPVPAHDPIEYLAYARSLHIAGVYAATEAGPSADAGPGREPFYSFFIAGLAKLQPTWSAALRDCSPPEKHCASALVFLKYAHVAFFALAAVIAGAATQALCGSRLAAIVATTYVSLNFTMWRELKYVLSDYLAVLLVAIAVLSLALALRRQPSPRAWIGLGVVLALLALTKQVFLPFAILVAIGLLMHGVARIKMGWRSLVPGLSVLIVVAVINGGWLLRNLRHFGVMSDVRGSGALSTREVFDNMTAGISEHFAKLCDDAANGSRFIETRQQHCHPWANRGRLVRLRVHGSCAHGANLISSGQLACGPAGPPPIRPSLQGRSRR